MFFVSFKTVLIFLTTVFFPRCVFCPKKCFLRVFFCSYLVFFFDEIFFGRGCFFVGAERLSMETSERQLVLVW